MSFEVIIVLLTAHWLADFVFQKEEWARGKHNSATDLLSHTLNYALVMFVSVVAYHAIVLGSDIDMFAIFYFWVFTLVTHTAVDFVTSKFTKIYSDKMQWYYSNKKLGFFPTIGLDQLIHYILLFGSYKVLFL